MREDHVGGMGHEVAGPHDRSLRVRRRPQDPVVEALQNRDVEVGTHEVEAVHHVLGSRRIHREDM